MGPGADHRGGDRGRGARGVLLRAPRQGVPRGEDAPGVRHGAEPGRREPPDVGGHVVDLREGLRLRGRGAAAAGPGVAAVRAVLLGYPRAPLGRHRPAGRRQAHPQAHPRLLAEMHGPEERAGGLRPLRVLVGGQGHRGAGAHGRALQLHAEPRLGRRAALAHRPAAEDAQGCRPVPRRRRLLRRWHRLQAWLEANVRLHGEGGGGHPYASGVDP
mmetsp:Transcript_104688/g.293420  ORF Transcript_104688/g.293420 Transcript_104688/m.293420 type:complete len:215 (+) Transcript_104688:245-889(+)